MSPPLRPAGERRHRVRRFAGQLGPPEDDRLVVEEPVEIRYDGLSVATVMRTPGEDRDLALGFLFAEGWIEGPGCVGDLVLHDPDGVPSREADAGEPEVAGDERLRNTVDLLPAPGARPRADAARRAQTATSSCGVCGKRTVAEALALRAPPGAVRPAGDGPGWPAELLASLPDSLRDAQELFTTTGALHAAGLFDPEGRRIHAREDIGRHNAVDKAVGAAVAEGRVPLEGCVLQVSGRVSFEIVQKAWRAGIPAVAAVSGVSTLAVELARRTGITLVGFVRGGRFVVYTGAERVV